MCLPGEVKRTWAKKNMHIIVVGWTFYFERINLLEGIRIAPTINMAPEDVNINVTANTLTNTHSPVG